MTIKDLQKRAREKFVIAVREQSYRQRLSSGEITDMACQLFMLETIDSFILEAVTEAYKADEIEERPETSNLITRDIIQMSSTDIVLENNKGRNAAKRDQQAKQRAFLGEGGTNAN